MNIPIVGILEGCESRPLFEFKTYRHVVEREYIDVAKKDSIPFIIETKNAIHLTIGQKRTSRKKHWPRQLRDQFSYNKIGIKTILV